MAETRPTATAAAKPTTSVQTAKKGNSISWVAPLVCVILGYIIWRFIIGSRHNFTKPDPNGGFWPNHEGAKTAIARMYLGGIIVPILIGCLLTVLTFVVERFLTVTKAPEAEISMNSSAKCNIIWPIKMWTVPLQNATVRKEVLEM